MTANGGEIRAVGDNPGAGGEGGSVEVQSALHGFFSVENPTGGLYGGGGGSIIDGAVGHRFKLHGILAVKDHGGNRIREGLAGHPVQYHVAHGDLTLHGLAAALCADDAGEPVPDPPRHVPPRQW